MNCQYLKLCMLALSLVFSCAPSTLSAQHITPLRNAAATDNTTWLAAIRNLQQLPAAEVQLADLSALDDLVVQEDGPFQGRLFLLAGWLGRTDALLKVNRENLRETSDQNDYELALIRAGHAPSVAKLDELLQRLEVNDQTLYHIAPKLIYTRKRPVIDYFLDQIMLDQNNCRSADPHSSAKMNCAYRLLELLAPVVKDFPLEVGPSGDLQTTDYKRALLEARNWIAANFSSYQIETENY